MSETEVLPAKVEEPEPVPVESEGNYASDS